MVIVVAVYVLLKFLFVQLRGRVFLTESVIHDGRPTWCSEASLATDSYTALMFRGAGVGPGRANGAFISAFRGSESFDIAIVPSREAQLSPMSLKIKQFEFLSRSLGEDVTDPSGYFRPFCPTIPTYSADLCGTKPAGPLRESAYFDLFCL